MAEIYENGTDVSEEVTDTTTEDQDAANQENGMDVSEEVTDTTTEDQDAADQENGTDVSEEKGGSQNDGSDSASDGVLPDASDSVPDAGHEDDEPVSSDDALEESDVSESEENVVSGSEADPFLPSQYVIDVDGESALVTVTPVDPLAPAPASVVSSSLAYTPQAFQVNLAENRAFGEHYLMWAQRVYYSGSSSYYWRYYLAVGRDITKNGDTYSYTDAEVYMYQNYNNSVTYDVSVSSGSFSGSSYLVYSDLYFDYVGVDPAASGLVYIVFFMFVILIAVLMMGGKRNV